ncbi:hypothetical protein SLEP1_g4067 [Rubroshorea leprosula]|uniref:beta-galactosidase n=1 Tax=Rubroshorea leprosula TaxID=152421 RepID=A0AAV5HWX0_9ROSI|nr:hypothetical protein SLEP1_g4067 [Rubroshorea leprosula]
MSAFQWPPYPPCEGGVCVSSECCGLGRYKYEWPELSGKKGHEAMSIIKKDNPWVTVRLVPPGHGMLFDFCCNRVYVITDENDIILQPPRVSSPVSSPSSSSASCYPFPDVNKCSITYDHKVIIIGGQRRIFISGSINYPRSTPAMWEDLIKKAKDGGLDVIDTNDFWNGHEPSPGNVLFQISTETYLFSVLALFMLLYISKIILYDFQFI